MKLPALASFIGPVALLACSHADRPLLKSSQNLLVYQTRSGVAETLIIKEDSVDDVNGKDTVISIDRRRVLPGGPDASAAEVVIQTELRDGLATLLPLSAAKIPEATESPEGGASVGQDYSLVATAREFTVSSATPAAHQEAPVDLTEKPAERHHGDYHASLGFSAFPPWNGEQGQPVAQNKYGAEFHLAKVIGDEDRSHLEIKLVDAGFCTGGGAEIHVGAGVNVALPLWDFGTLSVGGGLAVGIVQSENAVDVVPLLLLEAELSIKISQRVSVFGAIAPHRGLTNRKTNDWDIEATDNDWDIPVVAGAAFSF